MLTKFYVNYMKSSPPDDLFTVTTDPMKAPEKARRAYSLFPISVNFEIIDISAVFLDFGDDLCMVRNR